MTRGKLVVINNDGVYSSIEFNGDMYIEGCGEDAIRKLIGVNNIESFKTSVFQFNRENHNYDYTEYELVYNCGNNKSLFDMSVGYFDKWFSDYLYVKNLTNKRVKWKDRDGHGHIMKPGSITVICFGNLVKYDFENIMKDKNMDERMMQLPQSMYDELCRTLTDFENAPSHDTEDGWLSDGEWLDVFYSLLVDIQNSIVQ